MKMLVIASSARFVGGARRLDTVKLLHPPMFYNVDQSRGKTSLPAEGDHDRATRRIDLFLYHPRSVQQVIHTAYALVGRWARGLYPPPRARPLVERLIRFT